MRAGIRTVGDLAKRGEKDAERLLGSHGVFLRELAVGMDDRAVETERERKSVGAETTFAQDLPNGPALRDEARRIASEVGERLRRAHARGSTISVKLRYAYFKTITRQATLKAPTDDHAEIIATAERLLDGVTEEGDRFRLLGIQVSRLVDEFGVQGVLWKDDVGVPGDGAT